VGLTIRTCNLLLAAALIITPSVAAAKADDAVNQYAAARLAEIGKRDGDALKAYIKLYRTAPDSAVLADRIYDSAIRSGDMAAAIRAVRSQELHGEVASEGPLLLFTDAFRQKNWALAVLAVDELSTRSNLGFMAPILRSWINVAQGKPHGLPEAGEQSDPLFAFYSSDQRVYLDLAVGDYNKAKLGLRNMALVGGDNMRDLFLRASPIIKKQGDAAFAEALIGTALGTDQISISALPSGVKLSPETGLAALHTRISSALLEQEIAEPALVLARNALWIEPTYEPAKIAVARALVAQGQEATALALLASIPPTSPYWSPAVNERIAILTAQKRFDDALADATKGAARWPKSFNMKILVAQALAAKGDIRGAATQYREVADLADKGGYGPRQRANYRLLLASTIDKAGNWAAAKQEMEAALILDPNNAQILNYLGYNMLEKGDDTARAAAMIQRAYEMSPDSIAITDSMGWAHYQTGDIGKALPLLEKAAKAAGNDVAINEHLGDAYWRAGRRRDARYAWGVASEAADDATAMRLANKVDVGPSDQYTAH
jgi:tetratricopeptide (TPR) repeat protein